MTRWLSPSKPMSHASTAVSYRPDIDGLRAIAILAVVSFHAAAATLPGGFVGVDVFFVISGFLITRLIVHDLRNNQFSVARFYVRTWNAAHKRNTLMLKRYR
ncbi:MAG: acyltransferase [Nitrospirae bacterium]|nr:acyltransferase [Nitrospirota bacterium]